MAVSLEEAFERISKEIRSGRENAIDEVDQVVRKVIKGFSAKEIAELIEMLGRLRAKEEGDYVREVKDMRDQSSASSSRSMSMEDYYDNEARVSHRWLTEKTRRINLAIAKLESKLESLR